jgi:biopolymer transport protein TolR
MTMDSANSGSNSSSNSGKMSSSINVTPLIDVLLVLLIIFMVIVPATPKGEPAQVPQAAGKGSPGDAVVLEIREGRTGTVSFRVNQKDVTRQDLAEQLTAIYANRAERVLFVKGDDDLSFTEVAQAIDVGHAAGVDRIGLITPKARGAD